MPPNTLLARPLRSGQITLPAAFRRALRLVQVTLQGDELRIRTYAPAQGINTAIDQAIAHLRGDYPQWRKTHFCHASRERAFACPRVFSGVASEESQCRQEIPRSARNDK